MAGKRSTNGNRRNTAKSIAGACPRRLRVVFVLAGGLALAACGSDAALHALPAQVAAIPQEASGRLADPGKLSGLSAREVIALFGEPDFRRPEPPAELWQYRDAHCVLDVFLYSDKGGFRVLYTAARDRGIEQPSTGQCDGSAGFIRSRSRQSRL